MNPIPSRIRVGREVRGAVENAVAVVALESAVLTHGLPEPDNFAALDRMSTAVRASGAVPATCLLLNGDLVVGASRDEALAVSRAPEREKASVRDLGSCLARRVPAGLTVSATLFAAAATGIKAFATGGIGGVHMDASETSDVSTDLVQLSRSPVVTVCSGAKSVLDIRRTLEMLETLGVPIVGYRTRQFPAFYLTSSGQEIECVESVDAIVAIARIQKELGYPAGVIVGNPIPEGDAIEPHLWQQWLMEARDSAAAAGIRGKAVTPYLLDQVARASAGQTVRANLALLEANARLAGEIAVAFTE